MEWEELKKGILNKTLPNLVILTGNEYLVNVYIQQIKSNFTSKNLTTIQNYFDNICSKTNNDDVVYILKDDDIIKENTSIWNYAYKNLVLIFDKLDKKTKFYKAFERNIVYFEALDNKLLKGLIKNRINVSDVDIEWLMQVSNYDVFKCLNDADKIKIFDPDKHQYIFNELKKDGLIGVIDNLNSFELSNAIINRNKYMSLQLLSKLKKEDIIGQLSLIYNSLRNTLIAQCAKTYTSDLKMSERQYKYLLMNKKYSIKELCFALVYISDNLNKIKYGQIEPVDVLNLFILEYV